MPAEQHTVEGGATARQVRPLLLAVLAALLTVLAGRWGMGLFTTAEYVHFSVNFPVEQPGAVLARRALRGPWARLPAAEWTGYPAGGLLAWGREGRLVVDLGRQGWIKRLVQPDRLLISSHWLRNVGRQPYRIRLALDVCGLPARAETFERDWDEEAGAATRAVPPGGTFNMDWVIDVPPERSRGPLVCAGGLSVLDADRGALLTFFPIRLIDSAAGRGGPTGGGGPAGAAR